MNKDTRLSDVLHILLHLSVVEKPVTSEVLAAALGTNAAVFRRTMAGLREAGLRPVRRGVPRRLDAWTVPRPDHSARCLRSSRPSDAVCHSQSLR
ncbi:MULTISPECIES: Rrf2 family transcriptional regulator [Azospirillum]|nr:MULTISPECIES: Rrf2 family transcriptional regulator [Azospirillum]MDW5532111.1 Rrf2 family transcriptional regulator [Azospirillum sp. NL1]